MYQRITAGSADELFLPFSARRPRGVYFVRAVSYQKGLETFLWRYHEAARERGVIIEEQLANPDERQLNYYNEVMGPAFEPAARFIADSLAKWMPRMAPADRAAFADALTERLMEMRAQGKSDSILRNVYIKMMCWLYYRFERLLPFLGTDQAPRVLYWGSRITAHELMFLRMISAIGADILLVETESDDAYLKQDPQSRWSDLLAVPGGSAFPAGMTLKQLRKDMMPPPPARPVPPQRPAQPQPRPVTPAARPAQPPVTRPVTPAARPAQPQQRPVTPAAGPMGRPAVPPKAPPRDPLDRFPPASRSACTNAWMEKPEMDQILRPAVIRGEDPKLFYNAFVRLTGVRDRLTYVNELYQLYQKLLTAHRRVCVVDGPLTQPQPEEIAKIRRHSYRAADEMAVDLAGNVPASSNMDLQRMMQRAFVRTVLEAAKREANINRLTTQAVYLLCWIQRYQAQLFQGYKDTDVPCFIKMGGCESQNETMYLEYLAQLPVDVLILAPDLNRPCLIRSDLLLDISGEESLPVMRFPKQSGNLTMQTAAAYAQDDLTQTLYTDTGLYRTRQFGQAQAITLQTTYDEVFILWDQELRFRPNFSTEAGSASIPVLYAKISGVEGKLLGYWQKIKQLTEAPDTLLVRQLPWITGTEGNAFQSLAVKALKNGRLNRDLLRADRQYPFGLLREEMQAHILDKIQLILDERLVRGTYENGTEYTVVSTVLNMRQELLRLIQGFDFTKKNPKLVLVHTRDVAPSLQDAVMLTFLNKLGFDIAFFVPTGYQTIERYLSDNYPVEHQIGEYKYDLTIPDFSTIPSARGHSWLNKILGGI